MAHPTARMPEVTPNRPKERQESRNGSEILASNAGLVSRVSCRSVSTDIYIGRTEARGGKGKGVVRVAYVCMYISAISALSAYMALMRSYRSGLLGINIL